jgi:hypothetical protein
MLYLSLIFNHKLHRMPAPPNVKNPIQEILGNRITRFVMWGTILILVVGIGFAITALFVKGENVKEAFSILQYVLGALLPLWGTWIGTILAYYYSKENFEAANKSVQQIVDKLTPEKKLQSLKSKDIMIPRSKLIYQVLKKSETLSKFKLKEDCLRFLEANKIKRVIILDEEDKAKYVIHRDLISFFIANSILSGTDVSGLTLQDMYDKGDAEIRHTLENSVKFLGIDSNLLDAKNIMDQQKGCMDIFITEKGTADEPVLGWITNVTIAENSIV